MLLDLGDNLLSGEIPPELGNLTGLNILRLDDSQLSGEIPGELGDLSSFTELHLDSNRLSGQIPSDLVNLSNLVELQLAYNRFTGCLPDELQDVETNDLDSIGLPLCSEVGQTTPEPTNECVQPLAGRTEISAALDESCVSEKPPLHGSGDRYARFYTFSLEVEKSLTITLAAEDSDTFLNLLEGLGKDGEIVDSNDDIVPNENLNSRIDANLQAGDYTIEATTYGAEVSGDFTLVVDDAGSSYFSSACSVGIAVEHPDANSGLVSDCEALISARETLAGDATLLWSTDVPMDLWPGITVDGTLRG